MAEAKQIEELSDTQPGGLAYLSVLAVAGAVLSQVFFGKGTPALLMVLALFLAIHHVGQLIVWHKKS